MRSYNGAIEALQLALRPLLGAVIGTLPQPLRAPAAEAGGKPNGVVDDLQETVGRVFTPRRVLTGGNENSERGATLTGRQGSGPAALPKKHVSLTNIDVFRLNGHDNGDNENVDQAETG